MMLPEIESATLCRIVVLAQGLGFAAMSFKYWMLGRKTKSLEAKLRRQEESANRRHSQRPQPPSQ